jgi:hypothetical protein
MFKALLADSLSDIDRGVSTIVGHQQMTAAHHATLLGAISKLDLSGSSWRGPGVTPRCWRYQHLIATVVEQPRATRIWLCTCATQHNRSRRDHRRPPASVTAET